MQQNIPKRISICETVYELCMVT